MNICGYLNRFEHNATKKRSSRNSFQTASECNTVQIDIIFKNTITHRGNAIGNRYFYKRSIDKCILPKRLGVTKSYLLTTRVRKGIVTYRAHTVRNGIVTRDTCGISYERALCMIKQNSALGYEGRIRCLHVDRSKIDIANESSSVYTCNRRGKLKLAQRGAIRKRKISNSRKTTLALKCKRIETYIVIKSIFAYLCYSRGNTDLGKI